MIEYNEARAAVLAVSNERLGEKISLAMALGRILGESIQATIDHPLFDQSAVDGYALRHSDIVSGKPLRVVDIIKAGDKGERGLEMGECSRIFTGAPLPPGADTTVMQELADRDGEMLICRDDRLRLGGNVRRAGEQIRAGAFAMHAGTTLNPAGIGFLASLGVQSVTVARLPKISIIVTGDEFAQDHQALERGKIYESNGQMLVAAMAALGFHADYQLCKDDPQLLQTMVATAASSCEVLILTGGVSVGDFDFSRGSLEANDFQVVFHQVAQKPGKPLLFAKRGPQYAFGLPGNPRAVLMCFYLYVLPLLESLMGKSNPGLKTLTLPITHDYQRKSDGKTHFLTGKLVEHGFSLLEGQASHMLQSFAQADLVLINGDAACKLVANDHVPCLLLPWASTVG